MLDVVNGLADGFVAVAVIEACDRGGLFSAMSSGPRSVAELARDLQMNDGHLRVALRLLDALGYLDGSPHDAFWLSPTGKAQAGALPSDLHEMLVSLPDDLAIGGSRLKRWLSRCASGWTDHDVRHPIADLLDGALLAPVLGELSQRGGARSLDPDKNPYGPDCTAELLRLFAGRGWAETGAREPRPRLNPAGAYLVESGAKLGVTLSYWPMLRQVDTLLFGNAASVFERDRDGYERHLDRRLNIFGSAAQHGGFFREMEDAVVDYFDSLPLEAQPSHIADLGCGDGTLLKRLHAAIGTRTQRGATLARYPLTLVAADYNQASLDEATHNLADLPHLTVQADIGDPSGFISKLSANGVDPKAVLHVRSFVDHDRPLLPPRDTAALARRRPCRDSGVHVDATGGAIEPAVAVQSLVEHLARWREAVEGHGLLVLEVHCVQPTTVRRLNHATEALHFDAYHGFSGQHLVEASTFLLAAAEAGLMPQTRAALRFPRLAQYTRITLNRLFAVPYRIRLAADDDLPALIRLEKDALAEELRSSSTQIERRLAGFPEGQLVAERDGEVIGAIYTQRIANAEALVKVTADEVESLHESDGPVGQLLWLLVRRDRRDRVDAEELLDFAIDYLAAMDGVERVIGVTRCRDYARRSDLSLRHDQYVALRDGNGLPIDPILLMHVSHGALIERVLEGYRPRDKANGGAGVLISYSPENRHRATAAIAAPVAARPVGRELATTVHMAVERVLGATRRTAFQPDRPLMDMGLESLDLLELRRSLGEALGVTLDPTFFFRHGTPNAIVRYFSDQSLAAPPSAGVIGRRTPEREDAASSTDEGRENIAVVGIACRMPGGAADYARFWDLLTHSVDAVQKISPERWRLFGNGDVPIDDLPSDGALLEDIDRFDAGFFHISPREAALLDPQQRLLLEAVWHALEDAGVAPDSLAGSATGLFLGLLGHDYETLLLQSGMREVDGHFATGNAASIASGRIAHFFDWHGPAVTIDTACSSSLVAVHQACRTLLSGDCSVAVAGGVNLTLTAHHSLAYLRAGMLSPDGRCKTFDASADGYGRGEGVGAVVLKRLADAERDGDRVLAVIRGSAVNQDGTGIGLTAPNQSAQFDLIRAALSDARVAPSEVVYLEAHGTGTSLGDPIEVGAAAAALGAGRGLDRPLLLGSVKANIGHLEAAAGVAGLIKVVLSLNAGELPGQVHFREPNPRIAWPDLPVAVVRSRQAWPPGRRIAGVSSYGFSGTNAHVVVEGYAAAAPAASPIAERPAQVLALSAKSAWSLRELAGRYETWLAATPGASLGDLCFTAGVGRSHFEHRAAVVAGTLEELSSGLAAVRSGEAQVPASVHVGRRRGRPRIGVLFTGQGSQWAGMGQGLYEAEPAFREVVERCCAAADGLGALSHPLREVLLAAPGTELAGLIDGTAYTQPGLYALQTGLWSLWRSWGLDAAAALGHSVGEFAAAHAAGVLSLEEGARLVARRGALMGALPSGGAMAAVFAPPEAVARALAGVNAGTPGVGLSLAAENGTHRVVSGPAELVDALVAKLAAAGARCQRLTVSHAFHSGLLDPMLDDLEAAAGSVAHGEASLALISNLTGAAFGAGTHPDAAYWRRHARSPVRYAEGVATLAGMGVDLLLELGPRPVLGPLALGCWAGEGAPVTLSSLRPGIADERALTEAVAGLYAAGGSIDFKAREAGRGRRRIALPGYPFERTRHWVDAPKRRPGASGHPLLGVEHRLASGEVSWTQELSATDPGWAADHAVFGSVVVPGALHACLAAATQAAPVSVRDGVIHAPLVLTNEPVEVQLLLSAPDETKDRGWRVFARAAGSGAERPWRLHASGRVGAGAPSAEPELALAGLRERDVGEFYAEMASLGLGYGPSFQGVERVWSGAGVARGEIAAPEGVGEAGAGLHPAVLDACFQVLMAALPATEAPRDPYVPLGWEALEVWDRAARRVVCEARLRERAGDTVVVDLWLRDAAGAAFGRVGGLLLKRATRQALLGAAAGVDELLYEVVWREVAAPAATAEFLAEPVKAGALAEPRLERLAAGAGFEAGREGRLEALLEQWAQGYALRGLRELGWSPVAGEIVDAAALRDGLGVLPQHARLFGRLLALLGEAGLLSAEGSPGRWRVAGPDLLAVLDQGRSEAELEGSIAWALLSRCGASLAAVLRGEVQPLRLLFPEQGLGAADLYRDAPVFRLANAALAEAVERAVAGLPPGRRLRVLEVGAGTGGTTASLLERLPRERTDYVYTDVSAGFFNAAEERFGTSYPFVSYRVLDIEREPQEQGFAAGGYDLVVASNVLHATRDVTASARRCRSLLAPGGALALLEVMEPRGWHDLTFGLLEGWWRFADAPLRSEHPLLNAPDWRRALDEAGFAEAAILRPAGNAGPGIVLARSPSVQAPGLWVLAADGRGTADRLAGALAARGQRVVVARPGAELALEGEAVGGVEAWRLRTGETSDWRELLAKLPADPPLRGVAHLAALDAALADSEAATTEQLARDAEAAVGGALALTQALLGLGAPPAAGLWLMTEGAQVVAGEPGGRLAGAALWGLGRTLAREHPELGVRRLDLEADTELAALLDELLAPDGEVEAARRGTVRLAPRLVRAGSETERLALPSEAGWRLARGSERTLAGLQIERVAVAPPGPGEVAVAVEAAGLNFRDVLDTLGLVPVESGPLGLEFAGRVAAVGAGVEGFAPGDRVAGLGSGSFGDRVTTRAALVARLPETLAPAAAATLPSVFVTAMLAFELAGLKRGDRVLIHAGAGGVGLAAIKLARAAGAEVFATASAAKRGYLRGLGVAHVHDSRSTGFAAEILAATEGRGVDVVLNSLTGEGFIAASLSALASGGRFVEIAKRDIWSAETMAAARPDVVYHILAVDRLMAEEPDRVGSALRSVLERVSAGELQALPYVSYPLGEARGAMRRMQQARHIGKIVLTPPAVAPVRAQATYLITGGLGGIGLGVAGWLADRGASHIALNGRHSPNAAAAAAVAALRARGVTVEVIQADVAEAGEVDRLMAEIEARMPPLAGVIHSAGVLRDGAAANQDWHRFAEVLSPKALGGWRLHRATLRQPLDLFVLFASTAGLLGSRGQANHAAANAFLDQLARHRRALGLPGLSVDWGAWSEIGVAAERRASLEASIAAAGIGWMAPAQGLAALGRALAGEAAQLAVAAADWERVPPAPLLSELLAANRARTSPPPAAAAPPIARRLARTPPGQRQADLIAWLGQALQSVLRLPEPPDPSTGFSALGMDSLMAVELRNSLNAQLRLDPPLPATILFDSPNLSTLAKAIQNRLGLDQSLEGEGEKPMPRHAVSSNGPGRPEVAIVGMACRFPLASDLRAYWRLLMEGTDAIVRIPSERFGPIPEAGAGVEMAGLLEGIADFDPAHFGISDDEALYIDPQHRLLLEATWHALENAGAAPITLSSSRTGVFIGVGAADFAARHANDPRALSVYSGLGSGSFAAANRISHVFGFTGPSYAVNTACASSLTALHLAVSSLHANECDLAVVGGVNLLLHSSEFVNLSKAGVLSRTGRCRSFSSDADGYVRGEGCGVVILRRLSDATAAGDRIAAVIRGSAISHVGASNGMSAPNGPAQEAVMRAAAAKAGIDPESIEYLEAQGTGTPLGDAIEMGAIRNVMTQRRELANPLRMGAVKTNIGNLEEASGMAGLIKTVLAMRHGVIPSTLHFRGFNQYIRNGSAPIRMVDRPESWPRPHGARRTAAVNGFGFGGANAHVILEEAPPGEQHVDEPPAPYLLAISARTPTALRRLATLYTDAVSRCAASDIQAFCASANTGRSDLGCRLAVIGNDRETLESRLRIAGEGNSGPGIFRSGQRSKRRHRVAFLFSGTGSFDKAPVSDLYRDEPVFREVIDRCAAIHTGTGDTALYELLVASGAGKLGAARCVEPALFALQSALAALWDSWGVRPDYVLGEGAGELAAAACAGALSLEDGMRLVIERARLIDRLQAQSEAGDESTDDRLLAQFEAFAAGVEHGNMKREFFSASAKVSAPEEKEAWPKYWREHVHRPVDVPAALRRLAEAGCDVFMEIGPNSNIVNRWRVQFADRNAIWLASLRTGDLSERAALMEAVSGLYVAGCPVDFVALHGGRGGAWDDLPLYPFERRRYWLDDTHFSSVASGAVK